MSLQGLRILDHGCDTEIDSPDTPLALWESLEKEVTGGWLRAILVGLGIIPSLVLTDVSST